jgi:hypothetical protein
MNKTNYLKQRNTPCNQNAQRWYFVNSINSVKKNKNTKSKQYAIANYYLNGNANILLK